jgi:hypothetical protein
MRCPQKDSLHAIDTYENIDGVLDTLLAFIDRKSS